MTCPYCMETLISGATVCKTCQRDVALVLKLRQENHDLEDRVHELEAELEKYRPSVPDDADEPIVEAAPPRPLGVVDIVVVYFVLPTLLLIGAHYLLVVKFDTSLIWLRTASIVLPAIFGLMLERRGSPQWYATLSLGIVVAAISVLGMSTVVHYTDGDAILPDSKVAWRETLEYVTSISLSYLLGALLLRAMRPLGAHGARAGGRITGLATFLVRRLSRSSRGLPLEVRVQKMVGLIRLGVSVATALGAVYTGFKNIL